MFHMTTYWTNESVLHFAGKRDPVEVVQEAAQRLVFDAVEKDWKGPPFDPFDLARILDIPVVAKQELPDARTVPAGTSKVIIEYNPTRPPQRLRFSLAHETATYAVAAYAGTFRFLRRRNSESGVKRRNSSKSWRSNISRLGPFSRSTRASTHGMPPRQFLLM
jgi:hypothetical protein